MRLPIEFFYQDDVRKLRKKENGDKYLVIYIEILANTGALGGQIYVDNELALIQHLAKCCDEDERDVEATLEYLAECGRICKVETNPGFYSIWSDRIITTTTSGKIAEV